jgi:hypothetical protein
MAWRAASKNRRQPLRPAALLKTNSLSPMQSTKLHVIYVDFSRTAPRPLGQRAPSPLAASSTTIWPACEPAMARKTWPSSNPAQSAWCTPQRRSAASKIVANSPVGTAITGKPRSAKPHEPIHPIPLALTTREPPRKKSRATRAYRRNPAPARRPDRPTGPAAWVNSSGEPSPVRRRRCGGPGNR